MRINNRRPSPSQLKVGTSVLLTDMARTALGRIIRVEKDTILGDRMDPSLWRYTVRLPNWQADGVHLDATYRGAEFFEVGHGRAETCRCIYCPGYWRSGR